MPQSFHRIPFVALEATSENVAMEIFMVCILRITAEENTLLESI
jgi:hypothetical protein